MRTPSRHAAIVFALILAGCVDQTFSTTALPPPDSTVTGLPYSLPRGFMRVAITGAHADPKGADAGTYTLSTTLDAQPTLIADPSAQYFLAYNHSAWSADQFTLGVDANGLLQTANVTAADKSGAVALKVAELIGQIATAAAGGGPGALNGGLSDDEAPKAKCSLPPFKTVFTFFPDEPPQPSRIFGVAPQTVTVSVTPSTDPDGMPGPIGLSQPGDGAAPRRRDGIVFRRPRVFRYTVSARPSDTAKRLCGLSDQTETQFVTVPDRSPAGLFWQDVSRGRLTTKTVKLSVSSGMLTGIDIDAPSEVLAAVTLPSDILKSLLSIPAAVLNFKVQQVAAQQGLSDAETKLLQSQVDLAQKRAELQQLRGQAAAGVSP